MCSLLLPGTGRLSFGLPPGALPLAWLSSRESLPPAQEHRHLDGAPLDGCQSGKARWGAVAPPRGSGRGSALRRTSPVSSSKPLWTQQGFLSLSSRADGHQVFLPPAAPLLSALGFCLLVFLHAQAFLNLCAITGSLGRLMSSGTWDPATSLLGTSHHFLGLFASVPVTRLLSSFRRASLAESERPRGTVWAARVLLKSWYPLQGTWKRRLRLAGWIFLWAP